MKHCPIKIFKLKSGWILLFQKLTHTWPLQMTPRTGLYLLSVKISFWWHLFQLQETLCIHYISFCMKKYFMFYYDSNIQLYLQKKSLIFSFIVHPPFHIAQCSYQRKDYWLTCRHAINSIYHTHTHIHIRGVGRKSVEKPKIYGHMGKTND